MFLMMFSSLKKKEKTLLQKLCDFKKVSPRCCCLSGIQSNISKHEKNNRQTTTTKEC